MNHTGSVLWLAVRRWCHTFMCTRSINSGSSLSWQRKLMISFMVLTKPDWSGLVLSTQNLSYNCWSIFFLNCPKKYNICNIVICHQIPNFFFFYISLIVNYIGTIIRDGPVRSSYLCKYNSKLGCKTLHFPSPCPFRVSIATLIIQIWKSEKVCIWIRVMQSSFALKNRH